MRCDKLKSFVHHLLIIVAFLILPREVSGFCHEIELVKKTVKSDLVSRPSSALWQVTDRSSLFTPLAAKSYGDSVRIKWFGHATFQITSSNGTRILTDPHIRDYLPVPTLPQHIVTTSHNHAPHSNIWMARGNPVILEGLSQLDDDWNVIHRNIKDFVFRVNDICIAHLGDLGHYLTPSQLKMLGKIDILLVPIGGGRYTVPTDEAREVTKQVKPRIAIPMHYWWEDGGEEFSSGFPRVRIIKGHTLKISKKQLPKQTEIVILSWDND
jgi:L-ascorbate metabolism protein UlaG (beta-lactamase superfamily)